MCTALLTQLVKAATYTKELTTQCMQFLLMKEEGKPSSGLATKCHCNASCVSVPVLLENTRPTPQIIHALVDKKMVVISKDVSKAVKLLEDDQAEVLMSLCTHCPEVNLNSLLKKALNQKKTLLALALMHHGAQAEPDYVLSKADLQKLEKDQLDLLAGHCSESARSKALTKALEAGDEHLMHIFLNSGPLIANEVHLSKIAPKILTASEHPLMSQLLDKVPPISSQGKAYFEVIERVLSSEQTRKADLIQMLLLRGADVKLLRVGKPDQAIHAATELALSTGMPLQLMSIIVVHNNFYYFYSII